ncbi:MAG: ribosome small subunit-dependent GTPase A [Betaproteobacteria bacterium]
MTSARGNTPSGETLRGLVVATYRRHYAVTMPDGETLECVLKGRSLAIACGDQVDILRMAGGGSIESIAPRTSLLFRSDAFREKLIAANVTQIVGVVAPGIGLDEELINRWMIAAESEGCRFVLAANKSDLPEYPGLLDRLAPFAALGYGVVELAATRDATLLAARLSGQHTVLVGQSGMGKSTIVNSLIPAAAIRVSEVSAALATGRHTTTATTLYPLPALGADTWIVDSPGMKAFGLAHLDPSAIAEAFVELRPLLGHCRFRDCRHDAEPGCAVQDAVDDGRVAQHRVALLHSMIREARAVRDPAR